MIRSHWLWYDVHHHTEHVVSTIVVDGAVETKTDEIGNEQLTFPSVSRST